jgi:hypothetical protein
MHTSNVRYLLEFFLELLDNLDLVVGQDGWKGAEGGELESLTSKV